MWDMWGDSCKRGLGGGSLIDQTDEATAKSVVPDVGGPGRWAYLEVILVSLVCRRGACVLVSLRSVGEEAVTCVGCLLVEVPGISTST